MNPSDCRAWVWAAALLLFLTSAVEPQSVDFSHGAFLGCFDLTKLGGISQPQQLQPQSLRTCSSHCRAGKAPFNIITTSYACHCTCIIPSEDARLPESACGKGGRGAALFYNHLAVDKSSCRVANVPLEKSSFNFHYNDYNAKFEGGVMTLKMDGTSGLRFTTTDGKHLYGVFQVTAKTNSASGAVTAFYLRSSDDYNTANHGDFEEIDFEFLNGNPGVPAGLWLNSYHRGVSGGERLVKPQEYRPALALGETQDASNTFLTYTINWQPDQVAWYANGRPLLWRKYDEAVWWKDMRGVTFIRNYRPPTDAMHVTFSFWADQDTSRAFGGQLDWSKSPFISQFKDLRRVLCDLPKATANGPQWLYSPAGTAGVGPIGDPAGGFSNSSSRAGGRHAL